MVAMEGDIEFNRVCLSSVLTRLELRLHRAEALSFAHYKDAAREFNLSSDGQDSRVFDCCALASKVAISLVRHSVSDVIRELRRSQKNYNSTSTLGNAYLSYEQKQVKRMREEESRGVAVCANDQESAKPSENVDRTDFFTPPAQISAKKQKQESRDQEKAANLDRNELDGFVPALPLRRNQGAVPHSSGHFQGRKRMDPEDWKKHAFHHWALRPLENATFDGKTWDDNINVRSYLLRRVKPPDNPDDPLCTKSCAKNKHFYLKDGLLLKAAMLKPSLTKAVQEPNFQPNDPHSRVQWAERHRLKRQMTVQSEWNALSIFGSAPQMFDTASIFTFELYNRVGPTTRFENNTIRQYRWQRLCVMRQQNAPLPLPSAKPWALDANGQPSNQRVSLEDWEFLSKKIEKEEWPEIRERLVRKWQVSESMDLDWQLDALTEKELEWWKRYVGFKVDLQDQVAFAEICYCPEPNPHVKWGWNDLRYHWWRNKRAPKISTCANLSCYRLSCAPLSRYEASPMLQP